MSSNLPVDLAEDASSFSAALLHVRYWHLAELATALHMSAFGPKRSRDIEPISVGRRFPRSQSARLHRLVIQRVCRAD